MLDLSKLKTLADDKLNVAKMTNYAIDRLGNLVRKGKKCRLLAFSPFPSMFSEIFSFRVISSQDYVVKG